MSHHRADYPQNRPYNNSKYSYQRNVDSDRKYGPRNDNLLVQLSGPDRHVRQDPSSIARACFQCRELVDANNQLRLILGIKANGASEFLAPAHLASRLLYDSKRLESPTDPYMKFKSLSPVIFPNVDALKDVLGEHMGGKNGRGSKANKAYELPGRTAQSEEILRCQYEYTRTIFRHMIATLPYADPLYGISSALDNRRIFSEFLLVSYNDYKMGSVKGFLDAAWGFVDCSVLKESAAELYKIRPHVEQDIDFQNQMFAGGRVRQTCQVAPTLEVGHPEDDRITLREHLRSCYSGGSGPICVLVHHWPTANVLLQSMNVDTSTWRTDLRAVLQARAPGFNHEGDSYDRKPNRRSRSRSPPRRYQNVTSDYIKREREGGEARPQLGSEPNPSESHRSRELEVYVVDTKALYSTVRHSANLAEGLLNAYQDFDLPNLEENWDKSYCAGNELYHLWALFTKMVDGPTVDQMYRVQFKEKDTVTRTREEDDEDEDEADGGNAGPSAFRLVPAASGFKDPYDFQNAESDDDSE